MVAKLPYRFVSGFNPVLGTRVDEPVIVVGNGDYPRAKRYIYSFETFWVALSVPAFVMVANVWEDFLTGRNVFQHIATGIAMVLEDTHFPGG